MKKRDINLLKMTKEMIANLEDNKLTWQYYSVIADQISKINLIYDMINENLSNKVKTGLEVYSKQKDLIIAELVKKVHKIALKAKGYAKLNHNNELLNIVDIEENELMEEPDSQIVIVCEAILNEASGIQEHLIEDFNLTEELIINASALLMQVKQMISIKDKIGKTESLMNTRMKENILELKRAFDVLDDLIYGIIEDEEFISLYRNTKKKNDVYKL